MGPEGPRPESGVMSFTIYHIFAIQATSHCDVAWTARHLRVPIRVLHVLLKPLSGCVRYRPPPFGEGVFPFHPLRGGLSLPPIGRGSFPSTHWGRGLSLPPGYLRYRYTWVSTIPLYPGIYDTVLTYQINYYYLAPALKVLSGPQCTDINLMMNIPGKGVSRIHVFPTTKGCGASYGSGGPALVEKTPHLFLFLLLIFCFCISA